MHVLIEGADGSGKSTLAMELARRLFMPVVNAIRPTVDALTDVVYALRHREPTIFDRLHLSEIVYGSLGQAGVIARGPARFTAVEIDSVCRSLGTFNIICIPVPSKDDYDRPASSELGQQRMVRAGYEHVIAAKVTTIPWEEYRIGDDVDVLASRVWHNLGRPGPEPTWGQFLESPRRVQ